MDEDEYPEEHAYFVDCTCEHQPQEHGWGHCEARIPFPEEMKTPGRLCHAETIPCPCEGGWEE